VSQSKPRRYKFTVRRLTLYDDRSSHVVEKDDLIDLSISNEEITFTIVWPAPELNPWLHEKQRIDGRVNLSICYGLDTRKRYSCVIKQTAMGIPPHKPAYLRIELQVTPLFILVDNPTTLGAH